MSLYVTNESADIYVTTPTAGELVVSIYQAWGTSLRMAEMAMTLDEAKELAAILTREIANSEARTGV